MANQFETREMYQNPILLFILIPVGAIVFFFLFDFCYKFYNDWKLGKDTAEVLRLVLEKDGLETREEMKGYAMTQYENLGYTDFDDISLIVEDDYIILVNYKSYFSMVGMVTGKKEKLAVARYKGYYNEYKEVVVEEFIVNNDDVDELPEEEYEEKNEDIIIK